MNCDLQIILTSAYLALAFCLLETSSFPIQIGYQIFVWE